MTRESMAIALCAWGALGCSAEAVPRAQLVIVVDTDLPLVSQTLGQSELSYDASIDVLRVDVLDSDFQHLDFREHLAPDPEDWPLSFGIPSDGLRGPLIVRLRAFNAELSTPGTLRGEAVLDPFSSASLERLVMLDPPGEGVVTRHVFLSGDCFARPASFSPLSTCVDAARLSVAPDAGDAAFADPTRAGLWPVALEEPCASASSDDVKCIPGGFTLLGDPLLQGTADGILVPYDPIPLRPVRVRPFLMDRTEFTVGELNGLLASDPNAVSQLPLVHAQSGFDASCTWLGASDPSHDDLPLNCVSLETATEVCATRNGRLPTEAEWEHAARGRGKRWRYPWGDTWPECCTTVSGGSACGRLMPEPTGSAANPENCSAADVSRDGVFDLGGNVSEMTSDRLVAYDEGCWDRPGVIDDPSCGEPAHAPFTARGGVFNEPPTFGAAPTRRYLDGDERARANGFRCVYEDGSR